MRRKGEIDIERSTHTLFHVTTTKKKERKEKEKSTYVSLLQGDICLKEKKEKEKAISEKPLFSLLNGS
jgi:hypothetical protein